MFLSFGMITDKYMKGVNERRIIQKNVVFWDIKTQFVPHKEHITSLILSPAS
jgi:hypothetical protein